MSKQEPSFWCVHQYSDPHVILGCGWCRGSGSNSDPSSHLCGSCNISLLHRIIHTVRSQKLNILELCLGYPIFFHILKKVLSCSRSPPFRGHAHKQEFVTRRLGCSVPSSSSSSRKVTAIYSLCCDLHL